MSSRRRIVSAITLVVAAYLIVIPFALSLFSRTADAEKLSDHYRPVMSEEGLSQFGDNVDIINAAVNELYAAALPQLQRELDMDEAEFTAFVAGNYPAVAVFLERAPEVVQYLNPATEAVLAQGDNFHDADQFPAANLPVTLGPWSLLGLGLGMAVVGLLVRSGDAVLRVAAVFVVGLGLVVGPLVLGWFHQTDAAEEVARAARAPFSVEVANAVVDDTYKIDAAILEMREAMFPAIGRELGMSSAEVDTYLHTNFPATLRLLDAWDASIYPAGHELSLTQIEFMDEFHNADATPYQALPWLFMAPGAVLLVAGAYGLRGSYRSGGRRRDASA